MQKRFLIALGLILTAFSTVYAQHPFQELELDSTKYYLITLNDGTELTGLILERTDTFIVLSTSSIPRIEIPFENIKSIKEVDSASIRSDGSYWFPNPNPTRYFFAPSALTLKRGEGYYQNSYLFLNSVNVGITDYLSLGGGFEILSTFTGTPVFFFTPKVGTQMAENFYLGSGVLIMNVEDYSLGNIYLIGTYGNVDDNISAGLSWGFVEGEIAERPFFLLAGTKRIARRTSLISENYFITESGDNYNLFWYGFRFFGSKLAADLGFINNRDIADWIAIGIPYVGFTVKF